MVTPVVRPCLSDNTWKLLESAIHEINNHNASGLSYEELYRWGAVRSCQCLARGAPRSSWNRITLQRRCLALTDLSLLFVRPPGARTTWW
jgi:hypothetical protein